HTAHIRIYPITSPKSVQKLDPYGITVDPYGAVWFTQSTNDHIGRLDPSTGNITFLSGPSAQFMEIASDSHGMLWITAFNAVLLVSLNPQTNAFMSYYASSSENKAGGIYGLTISPDGNVWLTMSAQNSIARFDVAQKHFVYYSIPNKACLPLGVVMDDKHILW